MLRKAFSRFKNVTKTMVQINLKIVVEKRFVMKAVPILRAHLIERIFTVGKRTVNALMKVDFEIYQGEFIIVMGRSGSGKTTLLNVLGGLDSPTGGKIFIDGQEATDYFKEPYATKYRRERIGFVFQSYNLLDALTVEENIALPLILRNETSFDIKLRTKEMLELVSLYRWRNHRPVELSGGQQQRVALARALITEPSILLADEPTGNLDSQMATEILQLMVDMSKELNQSIVLVTHDPQVASFGDRVLFFNDGKIIREFRNESNLSGANKVKAIMDIVQNLEEEN